jgi:hypothetical protein
VNAASKSVNAVRSLLADRRRSQRGSVLSGVLIIVAFLSIISGALMTELSTNFLLSSDLRNRANTEATINSAAELAFNQLQTATPLNTPCPAGPVATPILNGQTAVATYASCALVVDSHSKKQFVPLVSSNFNLDGTHAIFPKLGRNDYLVGDAAGNVYDYRFDTMAQLTTWTPALALGGSVTGPPLEMTDVNNPGQVSDLIPIENPDPEEVNPGCGPTNYCVAFVMDGAHHVHQLSCFMPSTSKVTAQPAAGIGNPDLAYFGDSSGDFFAYNATEGGNCVGVKSDIPVSGGVVAGPVVFAGKGSETDELYLVVADNRSSYLVHYTYSEQQGLSFDAPALDLGTPAAVGLALEPGSLPSRLAITFAGGQVVLAQVQTNFGFSPPPYPTAAVPCPSAPIPCIARAPSWCQCPGGDLIGVAGGNGGLYLFDPSLTPKATFPSGGPAIGTTPVADAAGDWFFGAADGHVYEVQRQAGQTTLVPAAKPYGSGTAPFGSSPIIDTCNTTWVCVYVGSAAGLDLIPLDARHSVLTACVTISPPPSPPTCSNPQLWASVEVGSESSVTTIHVKGWSYYSP